MKETEIGNRGSKSVFNKNTVKEQRVDGNWALFKGKSNAGISVLKNKSLRYTLTGFERNYQIKILSKQLNSSRNFSTINKPFNLNPWFIAGFSDAESSFHISINKNNRYKLGWSVYAKFQIGLNIRDLPLLLQI
jgi:hypothetical protein